MKRNRKKQRARKKDYDKAFDTTLRLKIECEENGVPKKKIEPLFKRIFRLIKKSGNMTEIVKLLRVILEIIRNFMDPP